MKYIYLMAGGAIGTLLRYLSSLWIAETIFHFRFPWGTFFVNLVGSFVIGLLAGMNQNNQWNMELKTFLFAGLLGGFTTYSSYALESLNLIRAGEFGLTIIYITSTTLIGLLMAAAGFWLGSQLVKN
ncbi:MAG: fluoride efflux transporter CrcB [Bacteroidetes bacterium]|nr:fluoride efflux transporter CrcB [Bacteroidota bacterium]